MWNDVEAKIDLLNFSHVAKAAAQLIQDAGGEPLTIGVSGNWGAEIVVGEDDRRRAEGQRR